MKLLYSLRHSASPFNRFAILLLALGSTATVVAGLQYWSMRSVPTSADPPESTPKQPGGALSGKISTVDRVAISPLSIARGSAIARSLVKCPAGECVIRHVPLPPVDISAFAAFRQNDFGRIVFEPDNPWYAGQNTGKCAATFNCGTFAVSDFVEFTPNDWLETAPTFDGFPTPIAVVIDSYFEPVCEFAMSAALQNETYETDKRLRDGDIVGFELRPREADRTRRMFKHVGRVKRSEGVNRLLSKFGQGPIVLSDLRFADRMFPGADLVTVYRFRNDSR